VVVLLPSRHKALSSTPSPTKKVLEILSLMMVLELERPPDACMAVTDVALNYRDTAAHYSLARLFGIHNNLQDDLWVKTQRSFDFLVKTRKF
jgi:hypothetical protein